MGMHIHPSTCIYMYGENSQKTIFWLTYRNLYDRFGVIKKGVVACDACPSFRQDVCRDRRLGDGC